MSEVGTHIPMDLTGATEPKPVNAGVYDLVITDAKTGESQEKKSPQIEVSIGIVGHEDAPNIRHTLPLIKGDDDENKRKFKALLVRRFLTLFRIPYDASGYNVTDFHGATARAELTLSDVNEAGNQYNNLIIPKIKEEGAVRGVAKPPKR